MEILAGIFLSIYLCIAGVFIFLGLDLKKWRSWLLGLCGLITGFLVSWVWTDVQNAFIFGLLVAFLVLYGGATIRWQRRTSEQDVYIWLSRSETDKKFPFLARIVRWFMKK